MLSTVDRLLFENSRLIRFQITIRVKRYMSLLYKVLFTPKNSIKSKFNI